MFSYQDYTFFFLGARKVDEQNHAKPAYGYETIRVEKLGKMLFYAQDGQEPVATGLGYWSEARDGFPLFHPTCAVSGRLVSDDFLPTEHLCEKYLEALFAADELDWKLPEEDFIKTYGVQRVKDAMRSAWEETTDFIGWQNGEHVLRHFLPLIERDWDEEYADRYIELLDLVAWQRQQEQKAEKQG